jgi:mono/diheme cytochrome c family protein
MKRDGTTRSTRGTGKVRLFLCLLCFLWFLPLSLHAAQAPARTVLDGVYSEAQAVRGHDFYTAVCSSCHGTALEGISAPPLKDDRFIERWREGMVDSLYDFIRERMPFGRRASDKPIPDAEYLDILTYILKMNGYRSGDSELTAGLVGNVMLVGMNGPKPVPDGSHVITVGCLVPAADGAWVVSSATEPARVRQEDVSRPAQLKSSSERKLGTLTFRLADLEAVPDFSPPAHSGHKMQVKGFLVRQPNAERISLTSIEMLDAHCSP